MIGRLLALVIGLFAGLAGAQMPEFAQQYRQRLGGAIDELRRVVARLDENAAANGLTRDEAIRRLQASGDPVVRDRGRMDEDLIARLGGLERQRSEFETAGPFGRLLAFTGNVDPGLARSTYLDYEPAWPATTEGLTMGGAGFLAGWGLILFLSRIVRRLTPFRRRRRPGALRSA